MAISIPYSVRASLLLVFLIPSVLCSVFVLYHFIVDRRLRRPPRNHLIILIVFLNLFYELTDIVWFIHYYYTGTILLAAPSFCLAWVFIDYAIFLMISYLTVWMTIERHILIFHSNWFSTQRKRFLIHYIPIILICIYPLVFYIYAFFVQDCESVLDYRRSRCGYSFCIYLNPVAAMWDSIVNYIVPIFLIIIFSAALVLRVCHSRQRARRQLRWRDYKKLVTQLLPLSAIYLVFYFPPTLMYALQTAGLVANVPADFYSLTLYLSYIGVLLIPFVGVASLSEVRNKCKNLICFWRHGQPIVGPGIIEMNRIQVRRTNAVAPVG